MITGSRCTCGKVGHTSKRQARRAHAKARDRLRFYVCPESGSWHATNDEKKRPPATKRQLRAKKKHVNRKGRHQAKQALRGMR